MSFSLLSLDGGILTQSVPGVVTPDATLTLAQQGMPYPDLDGQEGHPEGPAGRPALHRGELRVRFQVTFPTKPLSEQQRELICRAALE